MTEIDQLLAYAFEITKALTGLVGGGSEMFAGKIGEMYTADIEYCVRRIKDRQDGQHRLLTSEIAARRLK